jgi:hypothetical protein
MTPAVGGEVDDLLEPVWSWPERTMLTNPVGEGMPGSRAAATLRSRNHGAMNPNPTPPQELTATDPP